MKNIKGLIAWTAVLALTACTSENTSEDIFPGDTSNESVLTEATLSDNISEEEHLTEKALTVETPDEAAAEETKAEALVKTENEVSEAAKECRCADEQQHAYCEYMNGLDDTIAGGIYYGDINGDDIPEAVISKWPSNQNTVILYHNANGLCQLELNGNPTWGYTRYISETGQVMFCPFYGHTGATIGVEDCHLYGWDGSDYVEELSLTRDATNYYMTEDELCYDCGQAYINDEPVDNDIFEAEFDEVQKLRQENGYFPVVKPDNESFDVYMEENFPCFNNWDIIDYGG